TTYRNYYITDRSSCEGYNYNIKTTLSHCSNYSASCFGSRRKCSGTIVDAINKANQMNMFDVLIVGRGGGSIEELWSFNEEIVAKAIYQSRIPIISAVGHETDNTISDFVADLRAPTPTGAGEIAVPSQQELLDRLSVWQQRLSKTMEHKLYLQERTLGRLNQSYAFRYPEQLLRQNELELDR